MTTTTAGSPRVARRAIPTAPRTVALGALLALALASCTSGTSTSTTAVGPAGSNAPTAAGSAPSSSSNTATPVDDTVVLNPSVADGASVPVDTLVTVSAKGGTVTSVELSYQDPKAGAVTVGGDIAGDGSTWTAHSLLEPGVTYTLAMRGSNAAGTEKSAKTTFSTTALTAKQQISATLIQNGSTVGIAMPVIVMFSSPVTDKAAFERKMTVTSTPSQPGGWAWVGSREAHWRPKEFWKPGTKVSVKAAINGLAAGKETYGKADFSGGFTVGNALTMKADLKSHQMTVSINGAVARTIPITGGKPGYETRSGTKVIIEKNAERVMDAATTGVSADDPDYYRVTVKYAMRETWSGEFVHAAPWSVGSQGRSNVSHGCIGMSTANAQWLFNQAKVGDPITVTGTGRALDRGNGWTDWNISFEEFAKGSALN
mgnify:CR=1 FL=1